MNKLELEKLIKKNIHEYLYIDKSSKIKYKTNCYGCFKKNKSYTIYHINELDKFVFLGISNNESDAYEYLYEILEYIHDLEITKVLNEYFNIPYKERKKYSDMIRFYRENDMKFCFEFDRRIDEKKLKKQK